MKVVAIDQGTTGTKAFTLDHEGGFDAVAAFEHGQHYPQAGWVEHDAEELLTHIEAALLAAGPVDGIGIANQGETVVAWDTQTGRALGPAIVWQDKRTQEAVQSLQGQGFETLTQARAGLPLDPYFSASKLRWLLDHIPRARELREQGRLRLGTSDAFFLFRLTGRCITDPTTASRTSLMDLRRCTWDAELCELFGVPQDCLPTIVPTAGVLGHWRGIPVCASLVDQQASLFGHGCNQAGDAKITFGTGAFALALAGTQCPNGSANGLATTLAWQLGQQAPVYALDGGVYNAASAVNWAKQLGLFQDHSEINRFAHAPAISRGLAFVPALSGLACPHWDRQAAGLWIGMGLETTRFDLMQSLLEGVALRAAEVVETLNTQVALHSVLSVDGGMSRNAYFMQFLANVLQRQLVVPAFADTTALGTARMAFQGLGVSAPTSTAAPSAHYQAQAEWPVQAARERFGGAVQRARHWHEAVTL